MVASFVLYKIIQLFFPYKKVVSGDIYVKLMHLFWYFKITIGFLLGLPLSTVSCSTFGTFCLFCIINFCDSPTNLFNILFWTEDKTEKNRVLANVGFLLFSYKEDTDNATDSDDIVEYATTTAPDPEEENRETIERVIDVRKGRMGGRLKHVCL